MVWKWFSIRVIFSFFTCFFITEEEEEEEESCEVAVRDALGLVLL